MESGDWEQCNFQKSTYKSATCHPACIGGGNIFVVSSARLLLYVAVFKIDYLFYVLPNVIYYW